MKHKLSITLAVVGIFGMACSKPAPGTTDATLKKTSAEASATQNPNPQNDNNVQKGYDDTKKDIEERRKQEKDAERRKNDNFDVHPSGEPRRDNPTPPSK